VPILFALSDGVGSGKRNALVSIHFRTAASRRFNVSDGMFVLPAKNVSEDERCYDGGVGFHDEPGCVGCKLAPCDFLVGNCTGVGTIGGCGIGNLAEVSPEGSAFPAKILFHHGNAADGEVACGTAANLEETDAGGVLLVPVYEEHHDLYALDDHMGIIFAADYVSGEDISGGAVFPCGADDRDVLFACCDNPAVLGVDFIVLLENAAADHLIDEFIGKISLALCLGLVPDLYEVLFQTAESLFFRDAGICDAVVVVVEEFLLLLGGEVTVTGYAIIVAVGYQVHDILFEVVCRAADEGNLVLADHFCKGETEFCSTHGTCHGEEHLAAFCKEVFISLCSINEGCRVEMTIMMSNELRDRTLFHFV